MGISEFRGTSGIQFALFAILGQVELELRGGARFARFPPFVLRPMSFRPFKIRPKIHLSRSY